MKQQHKAIRSTEARNSASRSRLGYWLQWSSTGLERAWETFCPVPKSLVSKTQPLSHGRATGWPGSQVSPISMWWGHLAAGKWGGTDSNSRLVYSLKAQNMRKADAKESTQSDQRSKDELGPDYMEVIKQSGKDFFKSRVKSCRLRK